MCQQLREALDRMLAAEDPDEKARLQREFDRLFLEAMASKRRTAPDWQRAAANDGDEA